jgi:cytochrome c-type biogenesis protein CcmH/NrfF
MTVTTLLWVLLVPLIAVIGVILWLSESRQQRIRRLRAKGWSQQRIATHLSTTRYHVRRALA